MSVDTITAKTEAPTRRLGFRSYSDESLMRSVPVEAPIAFEYDGVAFDVKMATPTDLDDFAIGFTLAERLADKLSDIASVEAVGAGQGWVIRIALRAVARERMQKHEHHRLVESSCGLSGVDKIQQLLRPLPSVGVVAKISRYAVASAVAAFEVLRPLGRSTDAAHGAAFCDFHGKVLVVREDVCGHNALYKLVGALAADGIEPSSGFMVTTARCSYELVAKAVLSGCPVLATISAPTSLAIDGAVAAELTLVSLAKADSMLVVNDPHGAFA